MKSRLSLLALLLLAAIPLACQSTETSDTMLIGDEVNARPTVRYYVIADT